MTTINSQPISFTGADGNILRGEAFGNPEHPPVILLHGGGQTRHAWSGTAADMALAGWYAVAVDLRGHGDSDWSEAGEYGHDRFAADTSILAKSFDEPPVLVGASLGGISSLFALGANPTEKLARALVLVDIATRMEVAGASRIIDFMKAKPDGFASLEEAADAVAGYNPHRPRPKDLSGLNKNLRKGEDGRYRWHWDPRFLESPKAPKNVESISLAQLDEAAKSLTVPTLLVRGRMSDLLSETGAQEFLEQVPHAEFVDVSGAGHMVAGDRNDVFSTAVISFLQSLREESAA
ncbi:MAG: pimeloyl-ACP methyl ester carboxylesterase [Myxococcota bacterium]